MASVVLVLNAGSSSIKFALFPVGGDIPPVATLSGQIGGLGESPYLVANDIKGGRVAEESLSVRAAGDNPHHGALEWLLDWLTRQGADSNIVAIGHRVVHGAQRYAQPVRLTPEIIDELASFIPLAPLHQPHNIAGMRAIETILPDVPQVACFDTAFHRTQPSIAQLFALPRWITDKGVRRYGFHGLSYEYIADGLPKYLGPRADGRVIIAHLGNGASLCAMLRRRSMATTMGLTAIDGLMMGTRTGSIDPGVLLYLMDTEGMDAKRLTRLLYKESGLLGVSGISPDMRVLLASDRPEAREAVSLFCYRISREIGSLSTAIGGLDALVFTGGIGEHAAPIREMVCQASEWLGVRLDAAANLKHATRINALDSEVDVLVLRTSEEWIIARHTARLIAGVSHSCS